MDRTALSQTTAIFQQLLDKMGQVDVIVIDAGTGSVAPDYPLSGELDTVAVNVTRFTALANLAYHYVVKQGYGHIVGTSSIMALRSGPCPSYNASRVYLSNYLEGLLCRAKLEGHPIITTDVRPGFVDTDMANRDGIFWMASVEKAASQTGYLKKHKVVYITKRWQLIGILLSCLPFNLYLKALRSLKTMFF